METEWDELVAEKDTLIETSRTIRSRLEVLLGRGQRWSKEYEHLLKTLEVLADEMGACLSEMKKLDAVGEGET